ncbi:putative GTP pyrophosphokinase [Pullulanibacillus pueri]|uniref:GTP pyrophosphokinase n=1 Tax=Pullulanibacillus pueri TaxID=1437324 RepID=A0A8J3ENA4_9BACL|nr:GTP pyrophosphokinase family protein [Pullulanibacillus pueri]MBM7683759.1 putative GTP pyrophosphokinase [Pullulanibacillus pueri]GGH87326.1 GTP pyrophosphokinase [Pullulanibacillus pueri]
MTTLFDANINQLKAIKVELTRFIMSYKFALDEMMTKINILKEEFNYIHDYNPIEHIKSRIKSPESLLDKMYRKGLPFSTQAIRENIKDIAGIRIVCSFISDIYALSDMLQKQADIKIIETKDYIKNPKPNGYKSLHLILEIPVFMSDREEHLPVEIQIRTVAMDFWASLEHKIYYKFDEAVPKEMTDELKATARLAADLDQRMENLHKEVNTIKDSHEAEDTLNSLQSAKGGYQLPLNLLKSFINEAE